MADRLTTTGRSAHLVPEAASSAPAQKCVANGLRRPGGESVPSAAVMQRAGLSAAGQYTDTGTAPVANKNPAYQSKAPTVAVVGLDVATPALTTEYPMLFQYNVTVELDALSRSLGRQATFDDIPDQFLGSLARQGHDWFYALGVWRRSPAARAIAQSNPGVLADIKNACPDFGLEDVGASPFAVPSYDIAPELGGPAALARLRERLHAHGIKLMVDFVPNHTAPDHSWVFAHPEFYIHGSEDDLAREPQNYARVQTQAGPQILAHGKDPYFDGWTDTFQLNYFRPELRKEKLAELEKITRIADGARCDMAMLLLPDVYNQTWARAAAGEPAYTEDQSFWREAIAKVKSHTPNFKLMAEVYWGRESQLQQLGFDWTYDKDLYDRLKKGDVAAIVGHLHAAQDFQKHSARFAENHDEPRVITAFGEDRARAAQVVTYFAPGLKFFEDGQREGRRIHIPMQLTRFPPENPDPAAITFADRLLAVVQDPVVKGGVASLPRVFAAGPANGTCTNVIAQCYQSGDQVLLAVTNYSATQSQARVEVPLDGIQSAKVHLSDRLGDLDRIDDREAMKNQGLYVDLPPWGAQIFAIEPAGATASRATPQATRSFNAVSLRSAKLGAKEIVAVASPAPRPDLGQYTFAAMAPLVIGDPVHPDSPESKAAWAKFDDMLQEAKANGVEAISTDVWWGLVEPKDNQFQWQYYDRVADALERAGLCWTPILSFHQCGGNVGNDANVPLPSFIGEKYKDLAPAAGTDGPFFRSEQNHVSREAVSVWASQAAISEYEDLMRSFQEHFASRAGNIAEINVSLGPSGELRYPSYDAHDQNAGYPTRGALQAYSELAVQSFRKFALDKYGGLSGVNKAWGIGLTDANEIRPPGDAGSFFAHNDDKQTQYGRDLFDWYNDSLLAHGKLLLSTAIKVFDAAGSPFAGIDLGAKVPGIHWRVGSDREAEEDGGLIRTSEAQTDWPADDKGHGYDDLVRMFRGVQALPNAPKIVLYFTCLEMDDGTGGPEAASAAKSLVRWIALAAHKNGVELKGENALSAVKPHGWENIEQAIRDDGYHGLTLLRLPLSQQDKENIARLSKKYP